MDPEIRKDSERPDSLAETRKDSCGAAIYRGKAWPGRASRRKKVSVCVCVLVCKKGWLGEEIRERERNQKERERKRNQNE